MPRDRPDGPSRSARRASPGFIALVTILCGTVASCALGERPTVDSTPTALGTMTGDAAIDQVLELLDGVRSSVFTATYTALLAYGSKTSEVSVTQDGANPADVRRSVTIGDVRYISTDGSTSTCSVSSGQCSGGIDAARVSDTGITPEFAFGDMAKRLRRDAVARVGAATTTTRDLAGSTATCVDIPVDGGTKEYCAFADGALARFVGADLTVDVTDYEQAVDEALFAV